jgi:Glutathione S-transferase
MKIYYSPTSPFVRKCLVVAHEAGLADSIELLPSQAHPVNFDHQIAQSNPLGQVPTLFTNEGEALYDSRVICEYLDAIGKGGLFPSDAVQRWTALTDQSLADGLLDAALLARYEQVARPEAYYWADWREAQLGKIRRALAQFEGNMAQRANAVDIGTITLACAVSYLDLRFTDFGWRDEYSGVADWYASFAQRPSMRATELKA